MEKMKQAIFILMLAAGCPFVLSSQQYCRSILAQAQSALDSNRLQEALLKLEDVEVCDHKNVLMKERQKVQKDIFRKIEQQRQEAIAISKEAEDAARWARYSLAQLFEEKTTAALEKGEYAQAWLYNQQALRMAAAIRTRLPLSAGRLMLREMCPCPQLRVPKPETLQGSILALNYGDDGQLSVLEGQVIPSDSSRNTDEVQLSIVQPGDGIKPLNRLKYDKELPALAGQALGDSGQFVSLHYGESSMERYLAQWAVEEPGALTNTMVISALKATSVAISRNGALVAAGNQIGKVVLVRHTKQGDELVVLEVAEDSPVLSLAFNRAGNQLAAACVNGTITIWTLDAQISQTYLEEGLMLFSELEERTPRRRQKPFFNAGVAVRMLAFSPNGKYLAYGDENGDVAVLDLSNGLKLPDKPYNKSRKQASCLAFSPDGRLLASGDPEGYVSVWGQLADQRWEEIALVKAHSKEVTALAFHPDGSILSSGSKDGTLRQMPLRVNPFDFPRDQALELSEFFFNYHSGTQAVRREKIYRASFEQLPYKLEDNKLQPTGDANAIQDAAAQFYGGRQPYNAYTWAGELRREKGSKFWTEWTYAPPQENKVPRQYTETGRDENWLYLKDQKQDHRIRVPLEAGGKSVQLSLGDSWLDMNLIPATRNDSVVTFQPEGIRFGVDPNQTANWVGFQPGNRDGYNFKISKTDTAFFHLAVRDSAQTGGNLQIRIPKKGGWIQYQSGKTWVDLFGVRRWSQINMPVDIVHWDARHFIFNNVSLNQQSNFLEVFPGDDITLELDWETRTDNEQANAYCSGCIIQGYFGMKDVFSKCYISDVMPPGYYWGDSGHEIFNFKAPGTPGIYYVTHRSTLEYSCKENPGAHSNGVQDALAVIRVIPGNNPPAAPEIEVEPSETPEPEKAAMPPLRPVYDDLYSPDAFHRLQNASNPRQYIHVENLVPETGPINQGWWSALWIIEPVAEEPQYVRLRNRWTEGYLHVENYYLEQGDILPGWWSAMWELEPVEDGRYIRIKNRWIEGYLNTESGQLELGEAPPEAKSSWWLIEKVK